jgi:hypothetical protein
MFKVLVTRHTDAGVVETRVWRDDYLTRECAQMDADTQNACKHRRPVHPDVFKTNPQGGLFTKPDVFVVSEQQ